MKMRSIVCLVLAVLSLVVSMDGRKFRCDYTYYPQANGWLKLHKIPANWREARLRCHLEGGNLASPINNSLRQVMKAIIRRYIKPNCVVFTGIHATFSRGDFFSVEGVPLSKIYQVWANNQPDNYKDNDSCIAMYSDGSFSDVSCEQPYPYICYKQSQKNVILNECGTVDNDYVLDKRTGSCYKFHRVPRTWSRAYMTCAAEGGYLTIVNSQVEAQVVKEIFAKNPASSMVGNFWKDVAFVGFQDWGEHGDWMTIDGKTLEEAGYSTFSGGEPNNMTTGEFCGSIYRNGMFDDLRCYVNHAFICEKDPSSLLCEDEEN